MSQQNNPDAEPSSNSLFNLSDDEFSMLEKEMELFIPKPVPVVKTSETFDKYKPYIDKYLEIRDINVVTYDLCLYFNNNDNRFYSGVKLGSHIINYKINNTGKSIVNNLIQKAFLNTNYFFVLDHDLINADEKFIRNPLVYTALNTVFSKDQFEICESQQSSSNRAVAIHYPEITIDNGNKTKLLRNLFVILEICNDALINFGLIKTTYDTEDLSSGGLYVHSHFHSLDLREIRKMNIKYSPTKFCLGDGTPISYLHKTVSVSPSEIKWIEFLFAIKPYLEWESKSGTPYITIDGLKSSKGRTVISQTAMGNDIKSSVRYFNTTLFNYYTENNRFKIKNDEKLYNFVNQFNTRIIYKPLIREDDNYSIETSSLSSGASDIIANCERGRYSPLIFNGKEYPIEILKHESEAVDTIYKIPISILNTTLKLLENKINNEEEKIEF
jgi:hypothetical protein